jgi:hypothetical protein
MSAAIQYDPTLSKQCGHDCHGDCIGAAFVTVGGDFYVGVCSCWCHNSLNKSKAKKKRDGDGVEAA